MNRHPDQSCLFRCPSHAPSYDRNCSSRFTLGDERRVTTMARRLIMAENRMKMHLRETPWGKYVRLNELARHRSRIRHMKPSVDTTAPQQSPQQIMNRERSDLEQVLGGASNWIGTYKKGVKKLSDCRPWSVPKVTKDDPAPFSTLRIQPRDEEGMSGEIKEKGGGKGKGKGKCGKKNKGWTINCGLPEPPKKSGKEIYKMRVIEKSIQDHKHRISQIQKGPSVYSPRKKTYLSRGEAPWNHKPAEIHIVDEKLKEIRKWAMRHRVKTAPAAPTGIMAYLPAIFSTPAPEPVVESASPVTDEDAAKDPNLAQLKEVQEAGDPNF